jgi:hypothetical protein
VVGQYSGRNNMMHWGQMLVRLAEEKQMDRDLKLEAGCVVALEILAALVVSLLFVGGAVVDLVDPDLVHNLRSFSHQAEVGLHKNYSATVVGCRDLMGLLIQCNSPQHHQERMKHL